MKILIIQQRYGIGDLIIFLPYIHAISKKFKTKVSLLVKKSSKASDLLSNDENIDEIIKLDKDKGNKKKPLKLSSSGRLQIRKNLGPAGDKARTSGSKKTIQIVFKNKRANHTLDHSSGNWSFEKNSRFISYCNNLDGVWHTFFGYG